MMIEKVNKLAINKRLTLALLGVVILSFSFLAYFSGNALENYLLKEKESQLLAVAQCLEQSIEGSYEDILKENNALDRSPQEQVEILNQELQPIVNLVSSTNPSIGLGFYSRHLNQILSIGPEFSEDLLIELPKDSPCLEVYKTGKVETVFSDTSVCWDGESIFGLSYPIYRNGEIIGHTWANVKIDDIATAVTKLRNIVFLMAILLMGVVAVSILVLTTKQKNALAQFAKDITVDERKVVDPKLFPELKSVLVKIQNTTNQLRQERNLLDLVLNGLPVGVVMFNKDQRLSYANKAFEFFTGYPFEKIAGLQMPDLLRLCYDEEEWDLNVVEKVFKSKEAKEGYLRSFKGHNGQNILARVSTYPLLNAHNEITGTVSLVKDVTDSERLRLILKQEEVVFNKLNYGLMIFDKNYQCILFNLAAENLFNLSKEDMVGKGFFDIISNLPSELGFLKENLEAKKVIDSQEVDIKLGNSNATVILNFDILRDDNDTILGFVILFKDISELKHQGQIIAEQEKLASIGQMAAGMAHEMRNPLTAIKGFVHLLAERPICKEEVTVYHYLQIVKEEIDRLNSIIGDFLLFARPAKPNLEKVAVNDLLLETIFLVECQCVMNGINLKQSLDSFELTCKGDKNQLKQVILNLFSNAIDVLKTSKNKEIFIKTELIINNATDKNSVRITIADSGPGISKEVKEKLFTPFFTTKEHGTGLGLSGSLRIIENHGGTIKVKSEEGHGASFMIYLPEFRLS